MFLAIVLAILLSSFSMDNTKTYNIKRDSTNISLKLKFNSVVEASVSHSLLEAKLNNWLDTQQKIDSQKLDILKATKDLMSVEKPTLLEKVMGYGNYCEEDFIKMTQKDTHIKTFLAWVLYILTIIGMYYVYRRVDNWRVSLSLLVINVTGVITTILSLYFILTSIFNPGYLTLLKLTYILK